MTLSSFSAQAESPWCAARPLACFSEQQKEACMGDGKRPYLSAQDELMAASNCTMPGSKQSPRSRSPGILSLRNQDRLAESMIPAANHRHCGSFMWHRGLSNLSSDSAGQGIWRCPTSYTASLSSFNLARHYRTTEHAAN